MVSILTFWLVLSNSTLPVTPEKLFVAAMMSRIDWESLPPRRTTSAISRIWSKAWALMWVGSWLYFALNARTKFCTVSRLSVGSNRTMRTWPNAGLRQRLGDAQPLALERVGGDDVRLAEARDARRNRGEVVHVATEADIGKDLPAEGLEGVAEDLCVADSGIGVLVEQHRAARVEALVGIGGDIDALHHLVRHDAKRPRVAGIGDLDRGRAGVEQRYLRLLHERHDGERRVRAFLADHDVRPVLLQQPLGGLGRRQRAACRVLILDLELVAPGLVELFDRELNALLVLRAEIGARTRHREQPADLDHLVLGVAGIRGGEQDCRHAEAENG